MDVISIEVSKATINIGDLIFTFLSLGLFALIVIVVIWLLFSNKKRKHQLTAIDNKIDVLSEKANKRND